MKNDGSKEMVNTGVDCSYQYSKNMYEMLTGTQDGVNFDDLFLINMVRSIELGGITNDENTKIFSSVSQGFGKNKFSLTGGKENMFSLSAIAKDAIGKYAWRAARLV